ncbi:hypothetical protein Fcan01_21956 [Folsomia candida]|uniref:Uncharacterized protein n=1 Tax=Folsomia candida TaxID=158441 RepID=A0A226DEG4_FOLCA|nr:hypothetical protein Fcan01_21956 [Folsomia candida]
MGWDYYDLTPFPKYLEIIYVIESFDLPDWRLGFSWLKPVTDVLGGLEIELGFIKFIRSLFAELADSPVQVSEKGQLHFWRQHNPIIDENSLTRFWNTFTEAGISAVVLANREKIAQYLLENPKGFVHLNKVLDYTLKRNVVNCPTVGGGKIVFHENYLSMTYVFGCLASIPDNTTVIAMAQQTAFFESNYSPSGSISNVFVMSPNYVVRSGVTLTMIGSDGEAPNPAKLPGNGGEAGSTGASGMPGPNFIGIYEASTVDLPIFTCGGSGGRGQGGADGESGSPGFDALIFNDFYDDTKYIHVRQCVASPGQIHVKLHPNDCNGEQELDTCYADNDGVWVTIFGSNGEPGGAGGRGGSGGVGGLVFKLRLQNNSSNPTYQRGSTGETGVYGLNGQVGQQGAPGRNRRYKIDDYYWSGKYCFLVDSELLDSHNVSAEGYIENPQGGVDSVQPTPNPISPSAACSPPVTTNSFPITQFKPNIAQFVIKAESDTNIFVHNKLTGFIHKVKSNPHLQ